MDDRDHTIECLKRRVRRWRLATFVLCVLLVCSTAVGITMNLLLMLDLPRREEIMRERERAEDALREAVEAREQERHARQRAEQALKTQP
jgi:hypothetical protein